MDPSVAPDESFMIFAGNGPGSMNNSADIYICFQKDGKWGEPVSLGETVNSNWLENAPVLAPDGKPLYFTSMRPQTIDFPKKKENAADVAKRLRNAGNGSRNIWQIDISSWLNNRSK